MTSGTFSNPAFRPPAVGFRLGRLALLVLVVAGLALAAWTWLVSARGPKLQATPVDTTSARAWMKQPLAYATTDPQPTKAVADPKEDLLRQMALDLAEQRRLLKTQAEAIEALKKRPAASPPKPAVVPAKPPGPGAMLFVSHDLKEAAPDAGPGMHTLAPGATKIPCLLETKIVSDVEGVFTCKVSTNVYDTATGQHLLIPQGSTVLGADHANDLLYGSNRMNTRALTLTFPDGRHVELGNAPVVDAQGVTGLTGDVNNHYLKLFGAVLIGGALKGGISAGQVALSDAAGAGQVTSGLTTLGNQATTKVTQPYINIRPTITIEAGSVAHVVLLKPLHLPAMWQGSASVAPSSPRSPR